MGRAIAYEHFRVLAEIAKKTAVAMTSCGEFTNSAKETPPIIAAASSINRCAEGITAPHCAHRPRCITNDRTGISLNRTDGMPRCQISECHGAVWLTKNSRLTATP